ncbi:hypothetical protein [Pseudalkalibacillus hwajinpoensis]|uniref:hypothetical protein n=1 Tax=Guptibacillus hwajinpoensis TaxID=208199 RepID=UPI001CFD6673|nr:hypothetical protein [Pseudalkalibacillus hwajinpoensis]
MEKIALFVFETNINAINPYHDHEFVVEVILKKDKRLSNDQYDCNGTSTKRVASFP